MYVYCKAVHFTLMPVEPVQVHTHTCIN